MTRTGRRSRRPLRADLLRRGRQPNVVFAAYRPTCRRSSTAPCGGDRRRVAGERPCSPRASIYTVVSERARGHGRGVAGAGRRGRRALAAGFAGRCSATSRCPTARRPRRIALAEHSRRGRRPRRTTWCGPTSRGSARTSCTTSTRRCPPTGDDAVDDFLFDVPPRLLRADRLGARRDAAHPGRAGPVRHRLRPGRTRSRRRGVEGPRQRRPRVGRGVVPRDRAGRRSIPTASVPFGGDTEAGSVGGDVARAIVAAAGDNAPMLLGVVLLGVMALAARAGRAHRPPSPSSWPLGSVAGPPRARHERRGASTPRARTRSSPGGGR